MDYRYEENRLRSYDGVWPTASPVRPCDLAAAGLYFSGRDDRVRCFECRTEIGCWEPGDEASREHRRWSANCRFVRALPCGNVQIDEGYSATTASQCYNNDTGRDVCGRGDSVIDTEPAKCAQMIESSSMLTTSGTCRSNESVGASRSSVGDCDDSRLCKICYDNEVGVVFVPCGHIIACDKCAPSFSNDACPLCRGQVKFCVRAFFA